jgi:polar amino acid transport system permease protein
VSPAAILAQQRGDWDWDFALEIVPEVWEGMVETIKLTAIGISFALVLGLVLAILRRSTLRVVRWPVGLVIEFVRSTPLLVQLYFLFFVLPTLDITLSAFTAAVIGLGVHYAAYTSESYRAGIESVNRGQWEAAITINLSRAQTWRQVVLPQAIPTVLPALGNYVVASLKDAPLAATIAVPGILAAALRVQSVTFRGVEPFTVAGILFLAVSVPAALGVRYLERRYGYQRD